MKAVVRRIITVLLIGAMLIPMGFTLSAESYRYPPQLYGKSGNQGQGCLYHTVP